MEDPLLLDEFTRPDLELPIDATYQKKLVQPGATVKGMQLQAVAEECRRVGRPLDGERRYVAFRDYPGTELVDVLVAAAPKITPDEPAREGLRRLGRLAFPTLRRSLVGRVLFGALDPDPGAILALASKGYELSNSTGRARLLEQRADYAVLRLDGMYSFVDSWHLGIIEGALLSIGWQPEVRVRQISPLSADFLVRWTK